MTVEFTGANVDIPNSSTERLTQAGEGLTWTECFLQMFFMMSSILLILPGLFQSVGCVLGMIGCILTILLYMHLLQLYLWSEAEIRKKEESIKMVTLDFLVEYVFSEIGGMPHVGFYLQKYLKYEIIISWFLGFSFIEMIVCKNLAFTLNYYGYTAPDKVILLYICVPMAVMSMAPNLKSMALLAKLSAVVVIIMILETLFYVFIDQTPLPEVKVFGDVTAFPTFFGTVLFSVGITPLIFAFKNEMEVPSKFGSTFGCLNMALMALMVLCSSFSLLCYLRFGADTRENIVQNLPSNQLVAITSAAVTVTIVCAAALAFYPIFRMAWCGTFDVMFQDSRHLKLYEYTARILVFTFITAVALLVPSLSALINIISCFSWPFDTIFMPATLQTVIMWKYDQFTWKEILITAKNSVLIILYVVFSIASFVACVVELSAYGGS